MTHFHQPATSRVRLCAAASPHRLAVLTAVLTAGILAGCANSSSPPEQPLTNAQMNEAIENEHIAYVSGTAAFPEGMAVPPDSTLEVTLIDYSRQEAFARLLGRHSQVLGRDVVQGVNNPVIPFKIPYDTSVIDPRMSYTLRATVRSNGQLLLTTDSITPVLSRGAGTSLSQPLRLVRAVPAPPSTGNTPSGGVPLLNTYWRILSIEGQPVAVRNNQREPHMVLSNEGGQPPRANIYAGCNQISGGYTVNAPDLEFSPAMMSTKKACISPLGDQEARMMRVLNTRPLRWQIEGPMLTLRNLQGQVLLQARSEALR